MQIQKNKTMAIIIALILVSSTAVSLVSIPTATAHTPTWNITTTAYLSAEPNPIGVGQQMEIVMALNWVMPGALIQNTIRAQGFMLNITKPDGTTEVKGPYNPYDAGDSYYILYTPDQVGNYTLKFTYPGQVYHFPGYNSSTASVYYASDIYENDTFLGSTAYAQFIVQQDPIPNVAQVPLPTEYWTRPIFAEKVNGNPFYQTG